MLDTLMRTDRILVRQHDSDEVTEGGILLPEQSKVKQSWGTVRMIGPDVEDIEIGDIIAFASFAGVEVELACDDGKMEYLILSQDDVLLVQRECPSKPKKWHTLDLPTKEQDDGLGATT